MNYRVWDNVLSSDHAALLEMRAEFCRDGFLICSDPKTVNMAAHVARGVRSLDSSAERKNSAMYHYNHSPRLVELWKSLPPVYDVASDVELVDFLECIFGAPLTPFSTINFLSSTHQPLHADSIHFGCEPREGLGALWLACEEIREGSGPLCVVRESHEIGALGYAELGLQEADSIGEAAEHYRLYEHEVDARVRESQLEVVPLYLEAGSFVIWSADTVHGSPITPLPGVSRHSMVVHYHFAENLLNFVPVFSNTATGKFRERKIVDIRNAER